MLLGLCGPLTAGVALATWASYLFVYTPLKRRTPLATLVGAVPGALPPVIGWSAANDSLGPGAFILFAILFLWQVPHFLAIAWLYRDDYARAGFPMLPVLDREGSFTARQALVHSLALLAVSLTPVVAGMAGGLYLAGAAGARRGADGLLRAPARRPRRRLGTAPVPRVRRVPARAQLAPGGGTPLTRALWPSLNALLNATSACLLATGWLLIRRGRA